MPQTVHLLSCSLGDLTWTRSFKQPLCAEDPKFITLHQFSIVAQSVDSDTLQAWIESSSTNCLGDLRQVMLTSVDLSYPVCEVGDDNISYSLLTTGRLQAFAYARCLEQGLYIHTCWLYCFVSRPDLLPKLKTVGAHEKVLP